MGAEDDAPAGPEGGDPPAAPPAPTANGEAEAPEAPAAEVSPPTTPEVAADADPDAIEIPEDALILLTVRGMALFPGVVLPIAIGRPRSVRAVQAAVDQELPLGVVLQRNPDEQTPGPEGIYEVGTVAQVVRYITAPDGSHHVIAQGEHRFRVLEYLRTQPYLIARVAEIEEGHDGEERDREIEARFLALRTQAHEALSLLPQTPEDLDNAIQNVDSASQLTDMVATFMDLPADEKQEILETFDLQARMELVSGKLAHLVEVLRLSSDIREQTKGSMEKAQREYYLRQQLKTIHEELGEGQSVEIADLREKIDAAGMSAEAHKEALKELSRLERVPEAAAEHGLIRTYLETLLELPWNVSSTDDIDLERARSVLDGDHYGLEKVKRRILEFLAVRKLKPDGKSPILCLVGPPGVGKTSLGQSVARAMGREFMRISLGGVHDEAEIRGHRRTYVGAMPGNIVQGLKRTGTNNPVFMLDEMDKLSSSFHGDPSSALLEVLDPAQNKAFRDNYLGVPFDLSRILFIGTANVLEAIPGPLRDRCEVIDIPSYTEEEKLEIAKRYLVKRQLEANGLSRKQCRIQVSALRELIRYYTMEAGCRNLEREIGALCRHVATRVAKEEIEGMSVGALEVEEILGARRFESELALRTSVAGVATGLSWTPMGGRILFVEATAMAGKGELILTGQLGDVMRESARAAHSLVKARVEELGIEPEHLTRHDIHVHVPAGAVPKDGPSAGVALFVALVSLLTGRKVRSDLAMTGEISLRGLVLPVGGVKEKVLGAHRAGIRTVLLPERNAKDLEDVPESARDKLEFVTLQRVEDALEVAFEDPVRKKRKKKAPRRSSANARRAGAKRAAAPRKRRS